MEVRIEESWRNVLQEKFDKPYFAKLAAFIREEYRTRQICPVNKDLFRVFNLCPFDRVRVVILGQDPYPDPRYYYGICFSVPAVFRFRGRCATSSARFTTTRDAHCLHRDVWNVGSNRVCCR